MDKTQLEQLLLKIKIELISQDMNMLNVYKALTVIKKVLQTEG